jgi:hypothetical protein
VRRRRRVADVGGGGGFDFNPGQRRARDVGDGDVFCLRVRLIPSSGQASSGRSHSADSTDTPATRHVCSYSIVCRPILGLNLNTNLCACEAMH